MPDNAKGFLTIVGVDVPAGPGLGSAQAPVEVFHQWGVGDTLFYAPNLENLVEPLLAESYESSFSRQRRELLFVVTLS